MQLSRWPAGSLLVVALLAFSLLRIAEGYQPLNTYDLVISGGRVIDPESNLDAVRNIGISNGVIRAVDAQRFTGRTTLDASRMVVSPRVHRSPPARAARDQSGGRHAESDGWRHNGDGTRSRNRRRRPVVRGARGQGAHQLLASASATSPCGSP